MIIGTEGFAGLLRRFTMTVLLSKHTFAPSPRNAPEVLLYFPPKEGVGNAGCPLHPQARVRLSSKKHTSKRVHRNHPAFPHAMVLTVSFVLLCPGSFATVVRGLTFCLHPVGPT